MGPSGMKPGKGAKQFAETLGLAAENARRCRRDHPSPGSSVYGAGVLSSKLLKLPKTDVWARLLSVLGTRGGRSKALTWILAAWGIKDGVMELSKV